MMAQIMAATRDTGSASDLAEDARKVRVSLARRHARTRPGW
jgi:hypothetical protein